MKATLQAVLFSMAATNPVLLLLHRTQLWSTSHVAGEGQASQDQTAFLGVHSEVVGKSGQLHMPSPLQGLVGGGRGPGKGGGNQCRIKVGQETGAHRCLAWTKTVRDTSPSDSQWATS